MTLTCCWVPSLQVFPKQTGSCCAVSVTTLSCRQLPWGSCTMYALHQGFFWLHFLVFQVSLFLPVRHLCYSPKAEVSILKEADFFTFLKHIWKSSVFPSDTEEIKSFPVLQQFTFWFTRREHCQPCLSFHEKEWLDLPHSCSESVISAENKTSWTLWSHIRQKEPGK